MSGEVSVPKEAIERAVYAWYGTPPDEVDPEDEMASADGMRQVLEAAAPLIVAANRGREIAAELDAQADRIEHSAGAWGYPKPGTAAFSMQGVLADVVAELRARAAVLRGDQT